MKRVSEAFAIVLAALVVASGCGKQQPEQKQQAPPELTAQVPHSSGEPSVAGIRWVVPRGWTEQGARQMRFATYTTSASSGDPEGAECAVFFFGPGQGGGIDQNIDRWIHQFDNPTGESHSSREINGLKVSLVQVSGTYVGMVAPMMQGSGEKKEHYALRGAIVEAPEGAVFFKLTGPQKTVASVEGEFNELIGSLKKI